MLDLLNHTASASLYLIGDMIDAWTMKALWYWPQLHNEVIQAIMRKAAGGTQGLCVPGSPV